MSTAAEVQWVGEIAVNRFRPEGATGRGPCVVLGHGIGATAASGLEGFARAFAAEGIEALTFDYRGFGQSGGEPRGVVTVAAQLADYRAVIQHARGLESVDPDRVVVWGTSFAGGLALQLAADDQRLAAAVALTPVSSGLAVVLSMLRRDGPGPLLRMTGRGVRDLIARLRGRERVMSPIASEPGGIGALSAPGALSAYQRIAAPDWQNEMTSEVFLTLAMHRPGHAASKIRCPLLVQIGDDDQSVPPKASEQAGIAGRAEIQHYPADHFDVYPGQPAHDDVLRDQLAFLRRALRLESHDRATTG
jgi:dienelactone hydrolase